MAALVAGAEFGFKKRRLAAQVQIHFAGRPRQVVGVDPVGPGFGRRHVRLPQAQHGARPRVHVVHRPRAKTLAPHAQLGADEGQLKLLAGVAQQVFGLFAPGDVARNAHHAGDLARRVAHRGLGHLKGGRAAEAVAQLFFKRGAVPAPEGGLVGAGQAHGDLVAGEIRIGLADDVGRSRAKVPLKRRIAGLVHALGVFEPDQVGDGMQQGAQQPGVLVQLHLRPVCLGDVLDRAFKIGRHAVRVANQMGVFAHPNALSGLVAAHFRDEIEDAPVMLEPGLEFVAAPRLDIPAGGALVDGGPQVGFEAVSVKAHQGGVGAQLLAAGRTAVGANGKQIEQG